MTEAETLERDIVEIGEAADATALYTDEAQFESLLASIKAAIGEGPFDMNVKADREHLRSAAAKIAKVKTRVDAGGAELKSEAQKRVDEINGYRRRYKEALQALQDDTRMPLTDWEQAEKEREERVASILTALKTARDTPPVMGATAAGVEAEAKHVQAMELDADTFGDQLGYAEKVKAEAIEALTNAAERIRREEAERAELEALRREKAERESREAEEAEARKRAEEEAARAAEVEERRKREAIEAEARAQRMAEEAAEKARTEERERAERERLEAEAKARREQEAAEAKARAEREAEERRAANKRHRAKVMQTAVKALAAQGVDEDAAAAAITAIAEGHIPGVTIQF